MNRNGFAPAIVLFIAAGILLFGVIWYYATRTSTPFSSVTPMQESTSSPSNTVANLASSTKPKNARSILNNSPAVDLKNIDNNSVSIGNTTYAIQHFTSPCLGKGYQGEQLCDGQLMQINTATRTSTVLIPSLWKAIPEMVASTSEGGYSAYADVILVEGNNVFMDIYRLGGGEGLESSLGYYRFNIATKEVTKLSYNPGVGGCMTPSPDRRYVADYTVTDYSPEGWLGGKVIIFGLNGNKQLYSNQLSPLQSIDNNAPSFPTCADLTWDSTNTLSYSIFDSSKTVPDKNYPSEKIYSKIEDKTVTVP